MGGLFLLVELHRKGCARSLLDSLHVPVLSLLVLVLSQVPRSILVYCLHLGIVSGLTCHVLPVNCSVRGQLYEKIKNTKKTSSTGSLHPSQ